MGASQTKIILSLVLMITVALSWSERGVARQSEKHEATRASRPVTFDRDIAPIFFKTCAPCHHTGEAAPFNLLTYGDAKSHARQIADITAKRIMPPWLPGPGDYAFLGDDHLTDAQIALFQQWVDDGLQEGDSRDLPREPQFTPGWQLGKPDLILRAEQPITLPASGSDQYWNFIFRTPLERTRWVKAIEIHPAERRLVHHANLLVDRAESARREEKCRGCGFPGMELQIESETFDPDGHFFFWKPGLVPEPEPKGMAMRLDPGDDLVLNTHLQPSGKPETIQPSIGLYFTDQAATQFPVLMQLENDRALDIPPGAKNFVVTDQFTLPEAVDLMAIYPHAHYVCREMFARVILPDGTTKTLLHIPRWDQNWQAVFHFTHAIPLPRGAKVTMRYIYDNSSDNIFNPNDPPKRILAGNRATDEMAHLWLQVLPHAAPGDTADPRMVLLEALARHHVENNPADFEAHYNLAAMLQAGGAASEAIPQYEQALQLRPGDATVENALGGALLASGNLPEATQHLRAAIQARPDYFDAHYNLGNALASQGDYNGAVKEFGVAARLKPDDADAEANLGSALALTGKIAEAKQRFERALQLNPNHQLARQNLNALEKGDSKP
ncbi:MAG TPA: tetratricopeptide repeat protein [Candidatus Acidoferrum sp.]|nr:tetratricopeptide repeat protein [Candidatus Acidoferrum sp.]